MTLTEFLTARLDEVGAAAQRAYDEATDYQVTGGLVVEEHFVNWKPDRVLVLVKAQRTIIKRYQAVVTGARSQTAIDCYTNVLEDLATAFDDHPDYDERWKP